VNARHDGLQIESKDLRIARRSHPPSIRCFHPLANVHHYRWQNPAAESPDDDAPIWGSASVAVTACALLDHSGGNLTGASSLTRLALLTSNLPSLSSAPSRINRKFF
jgi:hypothetical protein